MGVYSYKSTCINKCGDGILRHEFNEECDDGNSANNDGCSRNCKIEPGYICDN